MILGLLLGALCGAGATVVVYTTAALLRLRDDRLAALQQALSAHTHDQITAALKATTDRLHALDRDIDTLSQRAGMTRYKGPRP